MKTMERPSQVKKLSEPALLPLARLAATTKFEEIPQPIIHEAKLTLLDTLGCIIRGYALEEAANVIRIEKEIGGGAEATIFCSGDKVPALAAARANGYLGDILELNDLICGHGGIAVVPAAMAGWVTICRAILRVSSSSSGPPSKTTRKGNSFWILSANRANFSSPHLSTSMLTSLA